MNETAPSLSGVQTASPQIGEAADKALAAHLGELRTLPGFPRASDDAILRMSLPVYYTACRNPFATDWVAGSALDRHGEKQYRDPGPFASDLSVGKTHPIYKAHSFPTKVPHEVIVRYILHYTSPGDVVLDGFSGTGMTGVAAQTCGAPESRLRQLIEEEMGKVQWGARRAFLQDLSPSASFIAAGLNLPIDGESFDRRSRDILERFQAEWGWMYETTHRDGRKGAIDFTVWSEVFTCPHCGGEVVFYEAAFDEKSGEVRDRFRCPNCGAEVGKNLLERRRVPIRTLAADVIERIEFRPIRIHYRLGKARLVKKPDSDDIKVLQRIAASKVPPFPADALPYTHMTHERNNLPSMGFTHIHHLFSDRALAALAVLWHWCSIEEDRTLRLALLFWVEQAIWGLSWMNRYKANDFSQVNRYQTGVYYVPSLSAECSPFYNLEGPTPRSGKRATLIKTWEAERSRPGQVLISTASSTKIDLPDACIDYVFVDPPFGGNIYYADLGYLVEQWHGVIEDPGEEAIVDHNKQRPKGIREYQVLMESCFKEFYRVLKPGRWMTVEFNNSSNQIWLSIQEALSAAGFVVADIRIFDKEQLSYRQVTAVNAVKRDLIISAYRPAEELERRFRISTGSEEAAWEFIREHLRHLPVANGRRGQVRAVRERMADRLYDRMVAYHVHRGKVPPLSASEFYAGLDQRLAVRDAMFFLPEQVEEYERYRLSFKELLQAELFITNESSALQWLRQFLRLKSRPFSEIQPAFFRETQVGLPAWENLPDLRQLLEENFLQDDAGRWYVPDPKRSTDLDKLRNKGLLKEFAVYANGKGTLEKFRSEAVRAGFKDAWARRDFNLIVSVGERLPTDVFADDAQLLYYLDNARRLHR